MELLYSKSYRVLLNIFCTYCFSRERNSFQINFSKHAKQSDLLQTPLETEHFLYVPLSYGTAFLNFIRCSPNVSPFKSSLKTYLFKCYLISLEMQVLFFYFLFPLWSALDLRIKIFVIIIFCIKRYINNVMLCYVMLCYLLCLLNRLLAMGSCYRSFLLTSLKSEWKRIKKEKKLVNIWANEIFSLLSLTTTAND